ncbi:MAG: radical SAM protein, partial [Deltaproteobacteria bacterium]|nr:radical SAM protein [Deltaproteobacteria bacterium]
MEHIFGPVLSRRLGFSLGVDLVPFKTCSLDCIYCQAGKTTHKTIERKSYVSLESVMPELKDALKQSQKIDYITLSGSGEPTLNLDLGRIITAIKKITDIPVAVLTNGTLLHLESVRDELMAADLVVPSLDAVSQEIFCEINKPHPHINVSQMIAGLKSLREAFSGDIWLEIMLVKGLNDFPEEIKKLKDVISSIEFEKVQLNTTVRPAADKVIEPVTNEELASIKELLGERCEVIAGFRENQHTIDTNIPEKIISIISRRPLNLSEISDSLGIPKERTKKHVYLLEQ